jgi:hypothetical protein
VFNQSRRDLASRKAHNEVIAEAEQLVVPSFSGFDKRQRCQIFVLLIQQRSHEAYIDR